MFQTRVIKNKDFSAILNELSRIGLMTVDMKEGSNG